MKKLSDYEGDEAIELWGDLLEPLTAILSDQKIGKIVKSGANKIIIAKEILNSHKDEATKILLRIDPTPINGLNIVIRLVAIIGEIGQSEELQGFFGFAEQAKTGGESIGLPTVNTEDGEN